MSRSIPLRTVGPRTNGVVIYRGPSLINGEPIVVIMTGLAQSSANDKTGAMLQTYILAADADPVSAIESGQDEAVCGDCIHRKVNGAGSCYVNAGQGPRSVYDGWKRDIYPAATLEEAASLTAGRLVRLGSYGDPVAVPVEVWSAILSGAAGHTGYTHRWRRASARPYRPFLMASADSERQAAQARHLGWRYFRVKDSGESRLPGEIVCPASAEAGKRRTCETCGACDGAGRNSSRVSVLIDAHGLAWKMERYALARKAMKQRKRFRVG